MINQFRLLAALLVMFMIIAVDFTSKLLSIVSDGMLVIGLGIILWPIIKPAISTKDKAS